MVRVALEHLVAVGERLRVLAQQVVHRGALVPPLGELGPPRDHPREGLDRRLTVARLHLLDAECQQAVDLPVARATPHLPQGALGKRPDERVGVAERPGQRGDVFHRAPLAEGASRLSSRLGVGGPRERPERLLARRLAGAGHGRDGEREQDERQGAVTACRPRSRRCGPSPAGSRRRRRRSGCRSRRRPRRGAGFASAPCRSSGCPRSRTSPSR